MAEPTVPRQRNRFSYSLEDSAGPSPIFVIQKQTSHLRRWHLRVEVGDRLQSWIVPRGMGEEPMDRRIAIPNGDAPLPSQRAEASGGEARVWDTGPYTNLRIGGDGRPVPLEDQLRAGHAILWLHGERIQGGYALIRAEAGLDGRWLLVRLHDEARAEPGA
ncbi:MAG TPA: DNA polymerase ligase N-terminal domain-containing protein [Longimicrobiales bacterium]|nr:DNA polymerase ligase N-terminal domain-containing protein [Longimicrobiales bacterium]